MMYAKAAALIGTAIWAYMVLVFDAHDAVTVTWSSVVLALALVGIGFNVPLGGDKVMISDKVTLELDVQLVAPQ